MSKKLVAYFSATGVTKSAAERLAAASGADIFRIVPETPYTKADLDWTDKSSRSSVEMSDLSSRPGISSTLPNMEQYNTVFIGFPIWWYVAPTIISTFLESYDFSGKTIAVFATSGGSGLGKTIDLLKSICPDAKWKSGKMMNHISDVEMKKWIEEICPNTSNG